MHETKVMLLYMANNAIIVLGGMAGHCYRITCYAFRD